MSGFLMAERHDYELTYPAENYIAFPLVAELSSCCIAQLEHA